MVHQIITRECLKINAYHSFRHGLHGFFRFAQQLVTDKLVFTFTKNRVNPCNPCQKKEVDVHFDTPTSFFYSTISAKYSRCSSTYSASLAVTNSSISMNSSSKSSNSSYCSYMAINSSSSLSFSRSALLAS